MMDEITSFGEWVKQRRKVMDLTQAQLAQRAGCAVITLKKIEQNERRPSQQMAELLAEHLAVPQPERAHFLGMARGQFVATAPSSDALRIPPYLAALPHQSPPRFVARRRELAQLQAHLDQALAGDSRIVFVSGEAGRGKTSLLAEFARQAQLSRPDLIVVSGVCSAQGDIGDPYLPFRDALALLTGDMETAMAAGVVLPEQARRLWAFLPRTIRAILDQGSSLLMTLVPGEALIKRVARYATGQPDWLVQLQEVIDRQQARSGQLEQNQLFEQLRQVLQTLAMQQPILVLLDDLQWIDMASLNLLFHLGRRFDRSRILLLGAYRASEVSDSHPLVRVITEFKRRFGDIQLDLEQFDPVESRTFVDALLDTESNRLDEHFRERLFWHTKGYPLFTIELLRHLRERGNLVRDQDGQWIETIALEEGDLPVRIEAVISQRLNRLHPALLEMLKIAAVEGEIFSAQVVVHVLHLDDRLILQRLSILAQDHWLVREHSEIEIGGRFLNRYQFSHIVFQHYLYRQLSQGERRLLHRAVAEALVMLYQPHTAEIAVQLAHHYSQAGAQTQAASYHLIAGDQALKGAALDEAIHYYRAALAGWPAGDETGRAQTLRKLGECLLMAGQISAALEELQACYLLWERLGNRIGAGAVQRLMGRLYWEQGERAVSLQHYHRALRILESEPESVELAQAVSSISQMHMLASEYEAALAWGERALALAKWLDAQEVVVHASNNIGVALTNLSRFEDGLALVRESLHQALILNMPHDACRAYVNLGVALTWHGQYDEAAATFEKLLVYATQAGTTVFQGMPLALLTKLEWWQGHWVAAMSRCQEIKNWHSEFRGATVPKVWASTLLGSIYNDLGQTQLARQELEGELRTARTLDEAQTTVPHLGELARSLAALGREEETADLIQELLVLLKRTPSNHSNCIPPILFAFRWSVQNRANPQSLEAARDCLYHLEQIEAQLSSQESRATLAEARGIEVLWDKKIAVAVDQFQQAVTYWANLNRPYDQARVLNSLGQSLLQIDDSRQAQAALNQAHSLVETLAGQLEDAELRASFLNSVMVQEIRTGLSQVAEARLL
jgi:tetratricopeptide (TPR) repeat protein/transcriptional regulator with XRE-family HTH domain